MKAITILNPWAALIANEAKHIETRSWATEYRGQIAIHAAKSRAAWHMNLAWEEPFYSALAPQHSTVQGKPSIKYYAGAVIAIANLVDCVQVIGRIKTDGIISGAHLQNGQILTGNEVLFGNYELLRYAWILKDVRRIKPVAANGKQRIWEWNGEFEYESIATV